MRDIYREVADQILTELKSGVRPERSQHHIAPHSLTPFASLPRSHFATILADPPWQFTNKTGKVAPEHRRLHRYETMALEEIKALPVAEIAAPTAHLYLWCPNALLARRARSDGGLGLHL